MKFWQENVDRIIEFNDKKLLTGNGSVSKLQMEERIDAIYEEFNAKRKKEDARLTDGDDLEELRKLGDEVKDR